MKAFYVTNLEKEITESKVLRHKMAYIELAWPVTHVCYLNGSTSRLALILDLTVRNIKKTFPFGYFY